MKRMVFAVILVSTFLCTGSFAQKSWTLDDCITYAVSNNIQVKRQLLATESQKADYTKSKLNMLPNLNFSSDGNLGFGRSIDPVTNLITFHENMSNSYSLSSSLNLFSGISAINTLEANKYMVRAGLESEKIVINELVINILGAYYQVLYAKGLENSAKAQLSQSEKQLFRIKVNVETGKEAVSKQYEMESRVSEDKLNYTIAANSTSQAVTALKQILELEPGSHFEVQMPSFDTVLITDDQYRPDSVFNVASLVLPRLKEINYELRASEKQIAAAMGGILPKLVVGGSIYTGYYEILGAGATGQESFSTQIRNNNSQSIFARLQVPIFNNYTYARNIKLAKIKKNDTELKLELERNTLYTDIENACLNYDRGKDEYLAALSNFEYNKKSWEVLKKKFEAGLIDVTDYSSASMNLFKAETEAVRTRLQLMIRRIIIRFYSTGDYRSVLNS